jgi:hypothetical protein
MKSRTERVSGSEKALGPLYVLEQGSDEDPSSSIPKAYP